LIYQVALLAGELTNTLFTWAMTPMTRNIVAGYQAQYDEARSSNNKQRVREWMQKQLFHERASGSSLIQHIPEAARTLWLPSMVDCAAGRTTGFVSTTKEEACRVLSQPPSESKRIWPRDCKSTGC